MRYSTFFESFVVVVVIGAMIFVASLANHRPMPAPPASAPCAGLRMAVRKPGNDINTFEISGYSVYVGGVDRICGLTTLPYGWRWEDGK